MRSLFVCAALLGAVWPAARPAEAHSAHDSLRAGAWALEFQPDLPGFGNRMELSAKRHFTDRSALGLALGVSATSSESGGERMNPFGVAGQELDTSEFDSKDFQVTAQYLFYPCPRPGVNVLLVFGPLAGWRDEHRSSASLFIRPAETTLDRTRTTVDRLRVGGRAMVGFEWFFTRRLSLLTSHGITIVHSTREERSRSQHESTETNTISSSTRRFEDSFLGVETTAAELSFSVYF